MKAFALFASALVSFSALAACPNLAGTYRQCVTNGQTIEGTVVTQQTTQGVTTYNRAYADAETGEEIVETFIADGRARSTSATDEETGTAYTVTQKAVCVGNALNIEANVTVQGQVLANLKMSATKSGNKLSVVTKGVAYGEQVSEMEVCE